MKLTRMLPLALLAATSFYACEEGSSIGSSIVTDQVQIVVDSAFTVTGSSVPLTNVVSRSSYQLLGNIDAAGYGKLSSDFMTAFMPSNKLTKYDGMTAANVDSIRLAMVMYKGDMVGDSLMPLGLTVYELTKPLPTSGLTTATSAEPYYNPAAPIASTVYNASVAGLPDSIASLYTSSSSQVRPVFVTLPKELGQRFYAKYLSPEGPNLFADPIAFTNWFPGLYVKNSFGSGRIMRFSSSAIYLYLSRTEKLESGRDTVYKYVDPFLAITPEVVLNNRIDQTLSADIKTLAASKPMVVGPIGYDTSIKLPLRDIVKSYRRNAGNNNVINNLTLRLPASAVTNPYGIKPPKTILMVRKDKREKFFADNSLTDNTSSFYATYNETLQAYDFTDMRLLAMDAIDRDTKGTLSAADEEFVITPINIVTETVTSGYTSTEIVIAITPYIDTPAMATFNLPKARLSLTFSKQTLR